MYMTSRLAVSGQLLTCHRRCKYLIDSTIILILIHSLYFMRVYLGI